MFNKFPSRWFTLSNGEQILLSNLTRYIALPKELIQNELAYIRYTVQDGERPDILSYRLYGTSEYWWVICMANEMKDPINDWPLTQNELYDLCEEKYQVNYDDPYNDVHHYLTSDNTITDLGIYKLEYPEQSDEWLINFYNLTPVTLFEHEENLNNEKRKIRLLDPQYISLIEDAIIKAFE